MKHIKKGSEVFYADDERAKTLALPYKVTFINENGIRLTHGFQSSYFCSKFINKLKHGKRCVLIRRRGVTVCYRNFC